MTDYFCLIFMIAIPLVLMILIIWFFICLHKIYRDPRKQAGIKGEQIVTDLIEDILSDNDILLTNVEVETDEMETELDNVIINENGVFIIEVKNYSGRLYGKENDSCWTRNKISRAGTEYINSTRNPIRQVKRQIYLLSKYLKANGIYVQIKGYVYFVNHNSPIKSNYVLNSQKEINFAIHRKGNVLLNSKTQRRLKSVLS